MKRPYDFDDIKRRRAAGESWASIAATYDRTKQAVEVATRRALSPGAVSVEKAAHKLANAALRWARSEVKA